MASEKSASSKKLKRLIGREDFGLSKTKKYHVKLPVKRLTLSCLLIMIVLKSFSCKVGNTIRIDYKKICNF